MASFLPDEKASYTIPFADLKFHAMHPDWKETYVFHDANGFPIHFDVDELLSGGKITTLVTVKVARLNWVTDETQITASWIFNMIRKFNIDDPIPGLLDDSREVRAAVILEEFRRLSKSEELRFRRGTRAEFDRYMHAAADFYNQPLTVWSANPGHGTPPDISEAWLRDEEIPNIIEAILLWFYPTGTASAIDERDINLTDRPAIKIGPYAPAQESGHEILSAYEQLYEFASNRAGDLQGPTYSPSNLIADLDAKGQ